MCIIAVNTCSFVFDSVSDRYKTKEMCDKAVDDCLTALKFVMIGLLQVKQLKSFLLICTQMKIYSTLRRLK